MYDYYLFAPYSISPHFFLTTVYPSLQNCSLSLSPILSTSLSPNSPLSASFYCCQNFNFLSLPIPSIYNHSLYLHSVSSPSQSMLLNYISHPALSPYHTSLLLPPHTTFSLSPSHSPLSHLSLTPTLCHTPLSHPNSLSNTLHLTFPPHYLPLSLPLPFLYPTLLFTLPFLPTPPLFNTYILLSLPPQSHSPFPPLTPTPS